MKKQNIIINGNLVGYVKKENININHKNILFLHGWGQSGMSFEDIYKILDKKDINYYGVDFPGFGGSPLFKNDLNIYDYAEFTKDFINKLELKEVTLVCHSFGGRVGILIGNEKCIKNLVFIGSAGIKPKVNIFKLFITKLGKYIFKLPLLNKFGEKIKQKVSSKDYLESKELKQVFLNVINTDLTKCLGRIEKETLLLWGEKDSETQLKDAKIMNKLIKNSKLKVYENGSHFVFKEFSDEITKDILEFIK